ncbi:MAG: hypothetical protein WC222_10425 [Parachlamydiales bacterium]|jgi:hypothetical protein
MLKKTCLFLLLTCASFPIYAGVTINKAEEKQVGRYQIIVKGDEPRFYLLDTATGQVWKSRAKNNWLMPDAWEIFIDSSPEYPVH